jgi:hypothetical protein
MKWLAVLSFAGVCGFASDPRAGVWELDVAKSSFRPGPAPRSETVTVTEEGPWVVTVSEGVEAGGSTFTRRKRYQRDGREYPVESPDFDTFQILVRTPFDSEGVYRKSGRVVMRGRSVVSPDRRVWTVTARGTEGGKPANHTMIYRRVR